MGANLKEVRERITSVKSTQQITKAMKMVSAAKLRRAQQAIVQMRPYADRLNRMMKNILSNLDGDVNSSYGKSRDVKKALLVIVTSDRGLCGAFNSNIIKQTQNLIDNVYADKQVSVLAIGKKSNDIFAKKGIVIANKSEVFDDLTFNNVAEIAETLMEKFVAGEFDKIEIVYNKFKNAATQIVMTEQFLPIVPIAGDADTNLDYIFEPSKVEIVEELIPKSLKTQLYKGIRDSFASEHGARMTAMHKATDNATELRDQLKLTYNKARQAAITNEILEIVGGAEALNN